MTGSSGRTDFVERHGLWDEADREAAADMLRRIEADGIEVVRFYGFGNETRDHMPNPVPLFVAGCEQVLGALQGVVVGHMPFLPIKSACEEARIIVDHLEQPYPCVSLVTRPPFSGNRSLPSKGARTASQGHRIVAALLRGLATKYAVPPVEMGASLRAES